MWDKYADLLVRYCLDLQPGQRVLVQSTYLAEPLLQALSKHIYQVGALPEWSIGFNDQDHLKFKYASEQALKSPSLLIKTASESFDAIIYCSASFNASSLSSTESEKKKMVSEAFASISHTRLQRGKTGELKWVICQYPTNAAAQVAEMSETEFHDFIQTSCFLNTQDPIKSWQTLSNQQQKIVEKLNEYTSFQISHPEFECSLSTKNRVWINSDGKRNMPSGEVFTSPDETSVNGTLFFDHPTVFQGKLLKNIRLTLREGEIINWNAEYGQECLDYLMSLDGARYIGEFAIGNNPNITRPTKHILFDEKISKTIHFAIGSAYPETGGTHQAAVHLDFITSMPKGSRILGDGQILYENGVFKI